MWKKSEIKSRWKKYNLWIIYIIITVIIFGILHYVHPNTDQENARYILSAISQSLAAILALAITVMFIVAQMSKRYSATRKIIFNPVTVFSMIVFGTGIILPLFALKFGRFCIGVNLSIVIAIFCILSLFPFLKKVSDVLMYDIGHIILYGETLDAIKSENETKAVQGIIELESICKYAIKESREDVISIIIRFLSRIGMKSAENKLWFVTLQVVYALENIGLKSVEKGFKYNSTRGIVDSLRFIASKTLKEIEVSGDFKDAVIVEVLKGLSDIGVKAAEKGLEDIIKDVAEHLTYVGRESEDKKAMIWLWCLGAAVTKYLPRYVDDVIRNIEELEETISGDWLPLAERYCMDYYPDLDLKDAFEKFKRMNNR